MPKVQLQIIVITSLISFCPDAFSLEETSKNKYFGVGGWLEGIDCPNMELAWKPTGEEDWGVFFHNNSKASIFIGNGMAIFSPDCKHFWFTPYYAKEQIISVYDSSTAKLVSSFYGLYPAWSLDSNKIYASRKNEKYQLWEFSISTKKENLIYEISDYRECPPEGETIDWHPVAPISNDVIKWSYTPINAHPPKKAGAGSESAKTLTINIKKANIISTEWTEFSCSYQ